VEARLIAGQTAPAPDAALLRCLAQAHRWVAALRRGESLVDIARREKHSESYLRTRAPLAFLSPKIQAAILEGRQPAHLTLERLVRTPIPLDWHEQERVFGFGT
jgi:site-specific DNA recombinase